MRAVILAAGRGSRLAPLTDSIPKCMVPVAGKPLLHRQVAALRAGGATEITVVRGYTPQAVQADGVAFRDNPRWQDTNMVRSLLCARDWLAPAGGIVSYSDIFYEPSAVESLRAAPADIALTYDVNWLALWSARFAEPLKDAETFRIAPDGTIREIGARPRSAAEVEGQYMGLIGVTAAGWATIAALLDAMPAEAVDKLDMTSMLSRLIAGGTRILGVPYAGRWGEVDDPDDLALYERIFPELRA